ncbi:MAG TPA: hypothetical protein VKP30_24510 [Polyangiaceae bacterium]|nr:hypothetical protein [Polyangiaceae bacterium]
MTSLCRGTNGLSEGAGEDPGAVGRKVTRKSVMLQKLQVSFLRSSKRAATRHAHIVGERRDGLACTSPRPSSTELRLFDGTDTRDGLTTLVLKTRAAP